VVVGQEEFDTVGKEDALHHGETLLVVTTRDTENITLPFISKDICLNLLGDLLFEEDTAGLKYIG